MKLFKNIAFNDRVIPSTRWPNLQDQLESTQKWGTLGCLIYFVLEVFSFVTQFYTFYKAVIHPELNQNQFTTHKHVKVSLCVQE